MVPIQNVQPGSPAQKAGLRGGMQLVSIDGHAIHDGLDYEFYQAASSLHIEVEQAGMRQMFTVRKEEYQPLGLVFESYLIDAQHGCKNKCVFCFIDQLPKGMRPSLYFKDDDERLSFLFGNYITLTNLSPREVERIIEMRFSPVNISVHTTNPALRVQMMKNKQAGKVLDAIPKLAAAGIEMNFQLVLLPGVNDGEELKRSIRDLAQYAPQTVSIAAVPVGLTKYREGLPEIQPYTSEQAAAQLEIMLQCGEQLLQKTGSRILYPADEWFLLAGRELPPEEFYEGYPQLENGVGMWRLLQEEFTAALEGCDAPEETVAEADIVVGQLAGAQFEQLAKMLNARYPGVHLHVHVVQNEFFGHSITVTGLLTGRDILAQLQGRLHSGRLLLPEDILRAEGDITLDDMTVPQLAQQLGTVVQVVPKNGEELLRSILESENDA